MKNIAMSLAILLLLVGANASVDTPVRPVLIGIYAQDYDATVTWYSQNFRFETSNEVVNYNANLRIGFLDNGAFELEIYADIVRSLETVRLDRDRFGMPGEGFVKLSLEATDLPQLASTLSANGVEFVREINKRIASLARAASWSRIQTETSFKYSDLRRQLLFICNCLFDRLAAR